LISTVRIGAGAWRKWAHTRQSGDTDQARTQIHGAQNRTQERKEKQKKLLEKKPWDGASGKSLACVGIDNPPLARATPLHSVALRAASVT